MISSTVRPNILIDGDLKTKPNRKDLKKQTISISAVNSKFKMHFYFTIKIDLWINYLFSLGPNYHLLLLGDTIVL